MYNHLKRIQDKEKISTKLSTVIHKTHSGAGKTKETPIITGIRREAPRRKIAENAAAARKKYRITATNERGAPPPRGKIRLVVSGREAPRAIFSPHAPLKPQPNTHAGRSSSPVEPRSHPDPARHLPRPKKTQGQPTGAATAPRLTRISTPFSTNYRYTQPEGRS